MSTRSYYSATIKDFLATHENYILAEMVKSHPFDLNDFTRDSWLSEIRILKRELRDFSDGHISLEFKIPRMGKRVDAVVSYCGILFLLEFKDGDTEYRNSTYRRSDHDGGSAPFGRKRKEGFLNGNRFENAC